MSKRGSYIMGLPLLGAAMLYTLGDGMPDCVGLRVLLTGATVFGAKLECGLDAVGATYSPNDAPPSKPAPSGCPCTKGRYVGGDVLDPHSYVWTWALDGREHTLAERPVNADDGVLGVGRIGPAEARAGAEHGQRVGHQSAILAPEQLFFGPLIGVCGCSASGPGPPFETAYSAIGAQVK